MTKRSETETHIDTHDKKKLNNDNEREWKRFLREIAEEKKKFRLVDNKEFERIRTFMFEALERIFPQ